MTGTITPIGVGTAVRHAKQATFGAPLNPLVAPGNTNPPIIGEPPPILSGGSNEVWIIATGGPNWGGCQVWGSTNNATYGFIGNLHAGARQGVLSAPLPSHADPDTADTLAVDLTMSRGSLLSGTQADADSFITLCYCDGELVAYQTASLTAQYKYNLAYLRRGVYGSPIRAHATGTQFARFSPNDPSLFRYRYPASLIGRTIYLKFPAFNIFGQALQSLAGLSATTYTLLGTGTPLFDNPLLAALAAGTNQDWGIVGTSLIASADLAPITISTGATINFGAVP